MSCKDFWLSEVGRGTKKVVNTGLEDDEWI